MASLFNRTLYFENHGQPVKIIKLDATDSTNSYLRELMLEGRASHRTVVQAREQRKGRGQRGASWLAEPGKNLTMSLLWRFQDLPVASQFRINMAVSLAVADCLGRFGIPDIFVKWPNDILSGGQKLCGILIENVLGGPQLQNAVIGIGLNVNQSEFPDLERATSILCTSGKHHPVEEVMEVLLACLELRLSEIHSEALEASYEACLFRKDKASTFRSPDGRLFTAIIRGVTEDGRLVLELEDQVYQTYGMKALELLY